MPRHRISSNLKHLSFILGVADEAAKLKFLVSACAGCVREVFAHSNSALAFQDALQCCIKVRELEFVADRRQPLGDSALAGQ